MPNSRQTKHAFAKQILYYKKIRLTRKRMLEMFRYEYGSNWNKSKLEYFNEVYKTGKVPKKSGVKEKEDEILAKSAKLLGFEKKGKTWRGKTWKKVLRFSDKAKLSKSLKSLKSKALKSGFKKAGVSGDVGTWTYGFKYSKTKGVNILFDIDTYEKGKHRIELTLWLPDRKNK